MPVALRFIRATTLPKTQRRKKTRMPRLEGKTALVVGAGSIGPGWGNGKATAVTFAREGAQVFCVDRNRDAAQETVDIIKSEGGRAIAFAADVSRAADVEAMVKACVDAWGGIDVLDNNVGIAETGGVVEVSEAEWDRVFAVNLKSAFLAMKHVVPIMQRQGGGSIINISSIASIRHLGISYVTYAASKAAMNAMTRTTAVEYAKDHVRVNCILPGLMKTPMVAHSAGLAASYAAGDVEAMWRARDAQVPMGHMGDAWDVANAALFLASDESKYVTGLELVVDGGLTLKVN
ncbi:Short-chain dehydrogenase/reductase SDR [Rhodopseudomonas palustris HaA2]|uniref:Short-chain dehydrogenase/reductase SDR n=2 Tax=Rhodopseudomonas palustris TaxID=1076 RepID=Q2IRZ5_RHOP2|nr:Short-chain dehydrogenase/reductase SDR [Rhodopseudomonas palustris HaA2]